MAGVVQEKSRALKFAEKQLLRHGWEQGKGLGRAEDGISEAIKVKIKCGKGGVGHKEGDEFTFHWWDHVFNKASASLQVESDQNGTKLKKTVEEDEDLGMISNKKPRQATLARDKLYGCFVKSSTLLSGQELKPKPKPKPKPSSSDDSSSSEEDDQKLDLSSTTKLSDADLMKACGGRTAHKGARHGFTMSAKLARLEQQEAVFMAKWGKKTQPVSAPPVCVTPTAPTSKSAEKQQEAAVEDSHRKKKESTENVQEPNDASESTETDVKQKKKKKRATEEIRDTVSTEADVICAGNGEAELSQTTKRKHKKKRNHAEQNDETPSAAGESESPEEAAELHTDREVKKKKKKKKKSSKEHREAAEEEEGHDTEQDCAPEEAEVKEEEARVKQKRKKCKKDKSTVDDDTNKEALPPKKKKKKKSKE